MPDVGRALYCEIDPYAQAWIRNLISRGLVCPGDVVGDIEDIRPSDIRGYNQFHAFAGVAVWSYALRRAGWPDTANVWTGSCPCQPFSAAGKGGGFADERHLWPAFYHLVGQCRPDVVLGEQVASKDGLAWFDLVQSDLEGSGYAAGAVDSCSAGFGAPHIRQRLYWMAKPNDTERWTDATRGHERDGSNVRWPEGASDAEGCVVSVTLYHGDCLEVMPRLPAGSVDLTVTSPPYDNLRTYNNSLNDWTAAKWQAIIAELYRVTRDGGVVVWVVDDATVNGSETGTSFRQALHAIDCGFNLHDTMIFEKAGTGACGSNHAYWQCFECMFVLSKGRPNAINRIADIANVRAGTVVTKGRIAADGTEKDTKRRIVPSTSVRTNIWRYHVGKNGDDDVKHPAKFPEKMAHDHIISWSNPGDVVFDPFLGSGTTGKMAVLSNRRFIGVERDENYFAIATDRIARAAHARVSAIRAAVKGRLAA